MFRCYFTKKLSKPGESPRKLVIKIRKKDYYRFNRKTGTRELSGHGTEIVQEVDVIEEHYEKLIAEGFVPQLVKDKPEQAQQERFYDDSEGI